MATEKGLEDVPEGEFAFFFFLAVAPPFHTLHRARRPVRITSLDNFFSPPRAMLSLTSPSINTGQIESNYDETVDSFDDMNLKSELLRGKDFFCKPINLPPPCLS